jgi:type III secretory pathway component EscS
MTYRLTALSSSGTLIQNRPNGGHIMHFAKKCFHLVLVLAVVSVCAIWCIFLMRALLLVVNKPVCLCCIAGLIVSIFSWEFIRECRNRKYHNANGWYSRKPDIYSYPFAKY